MRIMLRVIVVGLCAYLPLPVWAADSLLPPSKDTPFISLQSQRALAARQKPLLRPPANFLPLANKAKFFPLAGRARGAAPVAAPAQETPVAAAAARPTKAAVPMKSEQAQQLLSIFAASE